MRLAIVMTWATFGFTGAVDTAEPPEQALPTPQPLLIEAPQMPPKVQPAPPPAKIDQPKEPAKTEPAKEPAKTEPPAPVPTQAAEPLLPPSPAFMDPRAFAWTQHRLPPPDKPCLEMAVQLRMCLGDHRCWRERICDLLFTKSCCPGPGPCGHHCPTNP
jgi:hypothetical protein